MLIECAEQVRVAADLVGGLLGCPSCRGVLGPWGHPSTRQPGHSRRPRYRYARVGRIARQSAVRATGTSRAPWARMASDQSGSEAVSTRDAHPHAPRPGPPSLQAVSRPLRPPCPESGAPSARPRCPGDRPPHPDPLRNVSGALFLARLT